MRKTGVDCIVEQARKRRKVIRKRENGPALGMTGRQEGKGDAPTGRERRHDGVHPMKKYDAVRERDN